MLVNFALQKKSAVYMDALQKSKEMIASGDGSDAIYKRARLMSANDRNVFDSDSEGDELESVSSGHTSSRGSGVPIRRLEPPQVSGLLQVPS